MKKSKTFVDFISTLLALVLVAGAYVVFGDAYAPVSQNKQPVAVYDCDYKTISFNTVIVFDENHTVKGNVLRLVTDPLKLLDRNGNIIGEAGDKYRLFDQDDHAIVINGKVVYYLDGKFELFGDKYIIKKASGEEVGYASMNEFNTKGVIVINDNVVAEFESSILFNDFTFKVYEKEEIETSMLIISAVYSDRKYDSRSGSSSSSNND